MSDTDRLDRTPDPQGIESAVAGDTHHYDGTNGEHILRELSRLHHATRGGIHPAAPGDELIVKFEDRDGKLHEVWPGDQVYIETDSFRVIKAE